MQGIDVPDPRAFDWITIAAPQSGVLGVMNIDLGPGETEVLALAVERSARLVIIDERLGRRMASLMGVKAAGTAGLVLKAAKLGLIVNLEADLRALQRRGMWLSDAVIDGILAELKDSPS